MHTTPQEPLTHEHVVIVGIKRPSQTAAAFSAEMEELGRLVETAGGQVAETVVQTREHPDPATVLGAGKAAEVGRTLARTGIRTVVFDDDLAPGQQKNIEKLVPAKILDRTRLILDIFARRARSREGQMQVELAQLTYMVPRLTGAWRGFSQQMGGIGTRGPGERKIEVERRYVRERIKRLRREIATVRSHRGRAREGRRRVPLPQVALIVYTNAGKSTLLNHLVGERAVLADDKLFATLDPTTRRVKLPGGRTVLFTDTVGFIQKLPPHLIAAFRATLEEVNQADLLLHLGDGASPAREEQQKTVTALLGELGAADVPVMHAVTKADLLPDRQGRALRRKGLLLFSSATGDGIDTLLQTIERRLDEGLVEVAFTLPFTRRALLAEIHKAGYIVSERPAPGGSRLRVRIDKGNWARISYHLKNGGQT